MFKKQTRNNKIENYIDEMLETENPDRPPPTCQHRISQSQIDQLQLLYPYMKPQDYIKKLTEIYQAEPSETRNLQNLCYLGLGKKLVKTKSEDKSVEIDKVNMYIRDYMLVNV